MNESSKNNCDEFVLGNKFIGDQQDDTGVWNESKGEKTAADSIFQFEEDIDEKNGLLTKIKITREINGNKINSVKKSIGDHEEDRKLLYKGTQPSLEKEVQNAVNATGFGKFNYRLFAICASIFMNTAFGISSTGLIVPAAACDLRMNTVDKGRLTAAPMLGMVCGSYFWGCLTAMTGRKPALLATLFLDGLAGAIASIVPNFWAFVFLRFVNGFAITGQAALAFPYLGEFQPTKFREKILCWMEMAWALGVIFLPLLGWAIIPLSIDYRWNGISFASWNLFVLLGAMPSLLIGVILIFFPESPKYLIEDGQESRAIQVLARMYALNTGKSPDTYPVKFISADYNLGSDKISTITKDTDLQFTPKRKKKSVQFMIRDICALTFTILKPPYLKKTLITCIVQFVITSSYYTLMLWFPELFQRFAEFEVHHPNESASVCTVSTAMSPNGTMINEGHEFGCGTKIQESVYTHTLFLGLSCVPTSLLLPLGIGKLGYRFFLVFSTILSGAATIGLFFVTSSTQNLILSCVFEALTSMGISVVYCWTVDFYPTHLRIIAVSFSALWGRSGALLGNLLIGYLLDVDCFVPIAFVATQLILCGFLCCFLPGRNKKAKEKVPPAVTNQ